ncbi:MAG: hypothetical protein WC047_05240 [Kiritimatiellales bacterium]
MTYLVLDIETLPTTDPKIIAAIAEDITPPGNISKPETIAAWERDKKPGLIAEAVSKTALSGQHGRIGCIGWAWDEGEACALLDQDEPSLLNRAFQEIERGMPKFGVPTVVGHNVVAFDIRFIWQRAFVLGVKVPSFIPRAPKPWDASVFDTMVQWAGPRDLVGLDTIAKAMGMPGKTGSGADVAGMWQRGEFEALAAYCKSDIEVTRAVHRRMQIAIGEAA